MSKAGEIAMGAVGSAAGLLVPVVGPAAVQAILKNAVRLPMETRRNNWFNSIGEGLRELQDRLDGFDPNRLGENEEFVSTIFETTQMAVKTHRTEKLEALRNVVLNAAAGVQTDDVLRGAFLGYVDRFSSLHLKVLKLLSDPESVPEMVDHVRQQRVNSLSATLLSALPQSANVVLLGKVLIDLHREALIEQVDNDLLTDAFGCMLKRTTAEGDEFLRFIAEPAGGLS
ncbi:hypothetical protein MPAR168_15355 [Methylorubrum populi]|uniref:DUF445 domain-containing protein n=1 Tax=Methylobacterium radiotolerans TaxID=31998 RepID=A0ABU7T7C2_9HYPH